MSLYDDDKNNVEAVAAEMEDLANEHPEICFRIFDTHDRRQYVQIDINKACDGIDPGNDWQAAHFHSVHPTSRSAKLY